MDIHDPGARQLDILLIFPPQWSPFQPFLSLPSLTAYLRRKGHRVAQQDWNVDFYEHFIARAQLGRARERLEKYAATLSSAHDAYRNQAIFSLGVLQNYDSHRTLVHELRSRESVSSIEHFYECVTAFRRLLQAFSVAQPIIEIGFSNFSATNVMRSHADILRFCEDRERNPFIEYFDEKIATIRSVPRYFGISVIGTEQLLPSLTLALRLKAAFPSVPIIVGGSVFSRLVERPERIEPLFNRFFDVICLYEGEAPIHAFLSASDPIREKTPGIAYVESGKLQKTPLSDQLSMAAIPTPVFDGLDLKKYFTPEIVLPILTTRGCYWDKCAFCYHGMIYGDRYRMRSPETFAEDVDTLHRNYGARHFALNDEAIPPKLFERLPAVLPKDKYFFTGLYKFEKFYKPQHFKDMYAVGFRSLYIGLETASERVQRHMRKNNTQAVMISNLRDAADAGIWNHTFNFFGFPTETPAEARETIDFLIDHEHIIHSEGTGTFSFEHNAPIFKRPREFGVSAVTEKKDNVLEIYYDYETVSGISGSEAGEFLDEFSKRKKEAGLYQYGGWIPREQLLILLSRHGRDFLRQSLSALESTAKAGIRRRLAWVTVDGPRGPQYFLVDGLSGRIFETNRDAAVLLQFFPTDIDDVATEDEVLLSCFPALSGLFATEQRRAAGG